jgi:hypothetical protein
VLHFILDEEDPHRLIARMMADLPSGSYLVIGHAASDIGADTAAAMARSYNATASLTITPRDRATVTRFFDGLEMTGRGLPVSIRRPRGPPAGRTAQPSIHPFFSSNHRADGPAGLDSSARRSRRASGTAARTSAPVRANAAG